MNADNRRLGIVRVHRRSSAVPISSTRRWGFNPGISRSSDSCVRLLAGHILDEPAIPHHHHARRQIDHFRQLRRDQDDRDALCAPGRR
jgi:hypothetical protein